MVKKFFKPKRNKPPDFNEFWKKTINELQSVEPNIKTQLAPGDIQPTLVHEYVSFNSLNNARIQGYIIRWDDDTPRPLVVYTHGYLDQTEPMWEWAQAGLNVLGFDVRGFGLSHEAVESISEWGYVLTGKESPETQILRGAVCDYVRAVDVGLAIFKDRISRLIMHGISFAGGLGLMAESLIHKADLLAIGVPTFGWTEGRFFFAEYGSGFEINRYLESRHEEAEDIMSVLRYFDSMNFADSIVNPTLVGVGLDDNVVPPETVFAIIKHLKCPHEVMEFPMSHKRTPEETKEWKKFEDRWINLALNGVDDNFGKKS